MSAHDPIFAKLETLRQKFYVNDHVLDFFKPWERPPIASVYSVYGVNVPVSLSTLIFLSTDRTCR